MWWNDFYVDYVVSLTSYTFIHEVFSNSHVSLFSNKMSISRMVLHGHNPKYIQCANHIFSIFYRVEGLTLNLIPLVAKGLYWILPILVVRPQGFKDKYFDVSYLLL